MFFNIALAQGLKQAGGIAGEIAKKSGASTYSTPQDLIGTGINAALTMVGLIFLILMIYAGYLWLTSHGEEEPIKKAQKIIVSSIIGFILVVSAYAITVFVGKRFEVGGGGTTEDECTKFNKEWACQNIKQCVFSGNPDDVKTWENCDTYNQCEKNKCSGTETTGENVNVCCLGTQTAENAGGDPNKQVCCWVCKESWLGDFYDEPIVPPSGVMSEAACYAACTGEDADECHFDYNEGIQDEGKCTEYFSDKKKVNCDSSGNTFGGDEE